MTVSSNEQHLIQNPVVVVENVHTELGRNGRFRSVAYWVSQILNPPLVGLLVAFLAAAMSGTREAWRWTAVFIVVAMLIPTLYVVVQLKRGVISDIHMNKREERPIPALIMVVGAMVAWLLLSWGNAPRLLLILSGAQLLQSIVLFLITLKWKISAHSTSIATFFALCTMIFGWLGLFVLPIVGLVAWARITLKRHTPAQTAAGIVLGCSSIATLILMYGV